MIILMIVHKIFFSFLYWLQAKFQEKPYGKFFELLNCNLFKVRNCKIMRSLSAANLIHYTSPVQVLYYIEFPNLFFFFLEHFILTVERGTYIAINYFSVCMCLHPISGVFGASGKCCLKSFSYDNLYWNIWSWQWTEEQSKLKWMANIKLQWIATSWCKLFKAYKYMAVHY